ncbi:MAG TPA: hypothetical protein VJX67_20965 [Blastocatellia bacterium]|nr:hypothetical protein [Blastocatellia bacterium]
MESNHNRSFTSVVRKSILALPASIAVIALVAVHVTASPVRRIRFKLGATTAEVAGYLRGQRDVAHFVLRLRAGQHMHVSVESTKLTNPQINVIFPSGESMDRDMQGTQFDTDSTQAGDYRVDVYEGRKGDPGSGRFVLKIEVTAS